MISEAPRQWAALDSVEARLTKRGYQVVRDPSADQLPPFLRALKPDAIAVGQAPNLAIELIRPRGSSAETKVRQLQSLFANEPDWRLEVVYTAPETVPIEAVTPRDIRAGLDEARRLADAEPRAGLMLAWASLEAIGRRLEPDLASRGLSARSLVDLLVSTGHLPQAEGGVLRRLGDTRNAVAHGQLNLSPAAADIRHIVDLGERLVA